MRALLLSATIALLAEAVRFVPSVIWSILGRRRDEARLNQLELLANTCEVEPLVLVCGRVVELLEFARLPDVGFEPRFFRAGGRFLGMSAESRFVWLVLIGILGIVGFFGFSRPCALPWVLLLAAAWAALFYSVFHGPTYYRVVPGRLDIMSFRTFGEWPERVKSLSLRGTQIRIDLTRTKRFITLEGHGAKYEFERADTSDPLGFALAVALGAKSTAPTPNIPMDALLG